MSSVLVAARKYGNYEAWEFGNSDKQIHSPIFTVFPGKMCDYVDEFSNDWLFFMTIFC